MKIMAVAAGLVFLAAAGTTALAVEQATKPMAKIHYRMADDLSRLVTSVDTNRLELCLMVVSLSNVPPTNIIFTIHSASKGPIVFRPAPNGLLKFNDFPDDPELRRENPDITVNQPMGSFFANPVLFLPVPEEQKFQYNDLVPSIDEGRRAWAGFDKIITPGNVGWAKYIGWLLFHPMPKIDGVIFFFPNSGAKRATLKLQTGGQTRTYRANANGMIFLNLKNKLLSNNPEMILSEKPLEIQLDYNFGGTFYANYK
jgi:hypothetical protein